MIDLMNKKVKAQAYSNPFTLLPKGTYSAIISSIDDWKSKDNPSLKVYQFDQRGRKVQDENGKDVFTMEKDVRTYSSRVTFEVTDGNFQGSQVVYYLNLHPNQPWGLPAFLDACGMVELDPKEVPSKCLNIPVTINVDIEIKDYEVVDKETGLTSLDKRERNAVKSVRKATY